MESSGGFNAVVPVEQARDTLRTLIKKEEFYLVVSATTRAEMFSRLVASAMQLLCLNRLEQRYASVVAFGAIGLGVGIVVFVQRKDQTSTSEIVDMMVAAGGCKNDDVVARAHAEEKLAGNDTVMLFSRAEMCDAVAQAAFVALLGKEPLVGADEAFYLEAVPESASV